MRTLSPFVLFVFLLASPIEGGQIACDGGICCMLRTGGIACLAGSLPNNNYTDLLVGGGTVAAAHPDGQWVLGAGPTVLGPACSIGGRLVLPAANVTYVAGVPLPGAQPCGSTTIVRDGLTCQIVADRLVCTGGLGSGFTNIVGAAVSPDGDACAIDYQGHLSCLTPALPYPGVVTQVALTMGGGCAVDRWGTLRCWGAVTAPAVGVATYLSPGLGTPSGIRSSGAFVTDATDGTDRESLIPPDAAQVESVPGTTCWRRRGGLGCVGRLRFDLPTANVGLAAFRLTTTNLAYLDGNRTLHIAGVGSFPGPVAALDAGATSICLAVGPNLWTITVGVNGLAATAGLPRALGAGVGSGVSRYDAVTCSGTGTTQTSLAVGGGRFIPDIGLSPPNKTVAVAAVAGTAYTLDATGVLRKHEWTIIPARTTIMAGRYIMVRSGDRVVCAVRVDGTPQCWNYGGGPVNLPGPAVGGLAPLGRYREANANGTLPCPAGRYARAPGYTSARCGGPCAAGYWGTGTDETCAGRCPAGTGCPVGSAVPVPCPPGTAGLDCAVVCPPGHACLVGSVLPLPCPVGTAQPEAGQAVCLPCPLGWVAGSGTTQCRPCPVGTTATNATHCAACSPGRYSPTIGQAVCSVCPSGTVGTGTACAECPAGQVAQNGTVCWPCPAGTSAVGSQCRACPVGLVAPAQATHCSPCLLGQVPVNGTCSACSPGTYGPQIGLTACLACGAGTYAPSGGATVCLLCDTVVVHGAACVVNTCQPGTYLNGNGSCTICPPGRYAGPTSRVCLPCPPGTYALVAGSAVCFACPDGLECSDGLVAAPAGKWLVRDNGTARAAACPPGRCRGQSTCAGLRTGLLCGQCVAGAAEWSGSCRECPRDVDGGLVVAAVLLGGAALAILFFSAQSGPGIIGIASYFLQTSTVIVGPEEPALGWTVAFDLEPGVGGPCLARISMYAGFVLELTFPLLVLAAGHVLLLVGLAVGWWKQQTRERNQGQKGESPTSITLDPSLRASSALVLWCITPALRQLLRLAQCVDVGAGRVLYSLPEVSCGSAVHGRLLAGGLVVLVVVLSLLAALSRTRAGWDFLTGSYSVHAYWWPLVVIGRRVLTLLVAELLYSNGAIRGLLLAVLGLAGHLLHQHARPYIDRSLNRLESGSLLLLTLLALLVTATPAPYPLGTRVFMVLLVSLPTIGLVLRLALIKYRKRPVARASGVETAAKV